MNTQEEIQKRTAIKNSTPAAPVDGVQAEVTAPDNAVDQTIETAQNGGDADTMRQPQENTPKPGDSDIIAENSFVAKKEPSPAEKLGKAKTYVDIVDAFGKPKELTPEELEKERKREKAKAIISAISDGVSAVANMYYTSKGAVSTNLGPTLSEQNKKRYDAVIAKRESEQQAYINRLMEAGFKDQAEAAQKELDRSRQAHQSAENQKNRDNQVAMQDSQQTYQSGQNELNRTSQSAENDKQIAATAAQNQLNRDHQSEMDQRRHANEVRAMNNRLGNKNYTPSKDDYRLAELSARYGLTPKNGEDYTGSTEYREDGDGKTSTVKKNSPYSFFGMPSDVRNTNLNNAKTIDYLISNGVPESKIKALIPRIKAGEPIGRLISDINSNDKSSEFGYSPAWGVPSNNEIPGF